MPSRQRLWARDAKGSERGEATRCEFVMEGVCGGGTDQILNHTATEVHGGHGISPTRNIEGAIGIRERRF